MILQKLYTEFMSIVASRNLQIIVSREDSNYYHLIAKDGIVFYETYILKNDGIEQRDYEANHFTSCPNYFFSPDVPITIASKFTYGAVIAGFTYADNATDIFTITGSNNRIIKIKHISVNSTQSNTSPISVSLIKRSSENIGGTSFTLTGVAYDSSNSNATATVRYYTANPTTLGDTVGTLRVKKLITGTTDTPDSGSLIFSTLNSAASQDITLRSSQEVLAINMSDVTSAGNTVNIDIMWTEE